jgi:osmotically-inducible protein OsmY
LFWPKEIAIESSEQPEIVPAPSQFAAGDTSDANGLKLRIAAFLRDSHPNSQGVHVTVIGGTAVLRGTVSLPQDKVRCLNACHRVSGVIRVVDELIVAEEKTVRFDPDDEPMGSP